MKAELLEKILSRQARIGVVGLGYVGLPLAMEFAEAGFRVVGIDVDAQKVGALGEGRSHVSDIPDARLQRVLESGCFSATTEYDCVTELDTISICVPTPLRKTRDPDISFILEAARSVGRRLHSAMLVVLESTTYPGTTEELILPELESGGYEVGKDIFLAFSPERIDPGNPVHHTRNTPRILGGVTKDCTEVARTLYEQVIETVVPVSSTAAAEMVKLLENTFRAVNIGLVNETAIMCDRLGLSVWEVIEAASTKPFGFMPFFPGPGLGGHCIPIDPLYLSWKLKLLNYNARFIELASEVNAAMPEYCVTQISRALNQRRQCVNGAKILILGVAYKKDVSDTRESPALDIIGLLEAQGAEIQYADPHVSELKVGESFRQSIELTADVLSSCDIAVVTTDHSDFDYPLIQKCAPLVFDARNAFKGAFDNVVQL